MNDHESNQNPLNLVTVQPVAPGERTHDALGCRIDEPEDRPLRARPYLLPVAVGFSLLSFVVALPFSVPVGGIRGVNEHDLVAPSERFACWVLGRKFRGL